LDDGEYSGKNDVWSAGIILYEMLVGKKPWEVAGNDVEEYLSKIKKRTFKDSRTNKRRNEKLIIIYAGN